MKSKHLFQRILCGLLVLGMMIPFLTACSEPTPSENTTSEVSASTEEVSATVEEQTTVMNHLAEEVEALKTDVSTLNASIEKFKI